MRGICAAALCLLIPVLGAAQTAPAKASLKNATGDTIGEAVLTDTPHGVLMRVNLTQAPAGAHALHIHETGQCQPPFTTAGGHFNPARKQHGLQNPMGMHAGDLPNVEVPTSGALTVELLVPGVSLQSGPTSLFDTDGSAIVMHQTVDDYKSDPAGNAGARVVCGVITR
ncbi:MAG: superoxide dismutase family protein [Vicinamibacterales bacterium]